MDRGLEDVFLEAAYQKQRRDEQLAARLDVEAGLREVFDKTDEEGSRA